ncbi:MAG: ABC transporter ATP-binding protein [Anaerolinea sp.]|nr:ABC transporter ATP-binding protein [Anaerolinea sp.]
MSDTILQTHQLCKHFGNVVAVQEVSLQVRRGEVFGFLGPNGAGKTTTIGMILGLIHPTDGRIELFGQPVTPARSQPLRRVGSLVGAPALVPYLSGRQNLRLLARLYPDVDTARIDETLQRVNMTGAADRKVQDYSTGMKQRLGLAAALLHEPELIILDEPTNGLDPAGMREIRELIRQLAAEGVTIFLSSHLLHEVEQVCDRIAVIHQGKIVTQGSVNELLAQSQTVVKLRVPAPPMAAALLQTVEGVSHVETNGVYVQVAGIDGETAVAHLAQHGIYPGEVLPRRSDLEDVFLSLTSE